ncbi:MAG: thiamine phosphate synthase [Sedimentisphaerales bacterium]|nr:thiamine phosphate synthase [Sedimentisphaerales bacterium]
MDNTTNRIIDANFNRAREGLRVMEEFCRFGLNDLHLSGIAKGIRHDLCQVIKQIPQKDLLHSRDIIGDVGTLITTASEIKRQDEADVVRAAAMRLTEALRCLEEYTKMDYAGVAGEIEKLRYRAYDLEKRLLLRAKPVKTFAGVRLYVLLTESLCKLPILETLRQVLSGGADCIQLREKDKSDADLLKLAKEISRLCHEAGALFIMNDRPDLAVLANADGVHLGQNDMPIAQAKKILPIHMIVGKSTHNPAEVQAIIAESPDYIAVGSVFASPTKPEVECCGIKLIEQVRALYNGPVIAIGGVTPENAQEAITAGAGGVAVCQAVISSQSPQAACEMLKHKVS